MSTTSWKLAAAGLVALTSVGCGSAEVVTTDLEYVDSSIATRHDLYLDETLENRPLTLAQLGGERDTAIPIEVEVFGPVAAAWRRADDGSSLDRTRENLIAVWRIYDVRAAGPDIGTAETVDRELEGGVDYVPSEDDGMIMIDGVDIERPGDRIATANPEENIYLLVDWLDRLRLLHTEDFDLINRLAENHPGCL